MLDIERGFYAISLFCKVMCMKKKSPFVLLDGYPFPVFDINQQKRIKLDNALAQDKVFKLRHENECWEKYCKREQRAVIAFERLVFGKLVSEKFKFIHMPEEYSNYQWGKHSEFQIQGGGCELAISVDGNCSENDWYSTVDCISKESIANIVTCREYLIKKLRNTDGILTTLLNEDRPLKINFWLCCTGLSKRTFFLEKLSCGCQLLFRRNQTTIRQGDYEILDQNENVIGEVKWGFEKAPDDKEDDSEYWEVFVPLIEQDVIELQSVCLKKIIKHGSPKGKARKALAKVELAFKVKSIPEVNLMTYEQFEKSANIMALLSKIDYNRKCDIISGEKPHCYNLNGIFDESEIADIHCYEIITAQKLKNFKIDEVNFTADELFSFWNIFCPLRSCISRGEVDDRSLFKENGNLVFKLSFEKNANSKSSCPDIYLTIYRKPS